MKVKICRDCGMEFNAFGTGETIVDSVPGFGRWAVTAILGAGLVAGWVYEGGTIVMQAFTALYVLAMVFMHLHCLHAPITKLGKACPSCGREDAVDRASPEGEMIKAQWEERRTAADHGG